MNFVTFFWIKYVIQYIYIYIKKVCYKFGEEKRKKKKTIVHKFTSGGIDPEMRQLR